jgi:beta-glucosidase
MRSALPGVDVSYSLGAVVQHTVAELPLDEMTNPVTGELGARVRFLDADGTELYTEDRRSTALVYVGGNAPIRDAATFELETRWTPTTSRSIRIGFAAVGAGRVFVNGEQILDSRLEAMGDNDILASRLPRGTATVPIETQAGESIEIRFVFDMTSRSGPAHLLVARVGTEPAETDADVLIAQAVEAASRADAVLVVVGTSPQVESEGFDRENLSLPGRQDDLVYAVAAANPRTVVVVNAGSPVSMPWRKDVAAVILGWFGGQEFGAAVASVLLGESEPGGRLPTTWPASEDDVPVLSTKPVDGVLEYAEGIHIGYRAWLHNGVEPAYWLGAGRGYADIALRAVRVNPEATSGEHVTVVVDLENTSERGGKEVVQIYASRPDSAVGRPVRWLVGFASVRLAGGESVSVQVDIPTRFLAYWEDGWQYEEGGYVLQVGTSAAELPLTAEIALRS